jgi:hypothetical protein
MASLRLSGRRRSDAGSGISTEREIRSFERAGSYLGWRTGIRKDGTWPYFIAGD